MANSVGGQQIAIARYIGPLIGMGLIAFHGVHRIYTDHCLQSTAAVTTINLADHH